MDAPGQSEGVSRLRLLVGVHEGGFNGIDTYSEQVAAEWCDSS